LKDQWYRTIIGAARLLTKDQPCRGIEYMVIEKVPMPRLTPSPSRASSPYGDYDLRGEPDHRREVQVVEVVLHPFSASAGRCGH
jgi:hypothetical protein